MGLPEFFVALMYPPKRWFDKFAIAIAILEMAIFIGASLNQANPLRDDSVPKFWWIFERKKLPMACAYILKVSSQRSQKAPIILYFPPKNRRRTRKLSTVLCECSLFCHYPLNYIQICLNCETQPQASIDWVALSSVFVRLFVCLVVPHR